MDDHRIGRDWQSQLLSSWSGRKRSEELCGAEQAKDGV